MTSEIGDAYQPATAVLKIIKQDIRKFKRKRTTHPGCTNKRRKTVQLGVGDLVRVVKGFEPLPRQEMFEDFVGMNGVVQELFPGFCTLEVIVEKQTIHVRVPFLWVEKI